MRLVDGNPNDRVTVELNTVGVTFSVGQDTSDLSTKGSKKSVIKPQGYTQGYS